MFLSKFFKKKESSHGKESSLKNKTINPILNELIEKTKEEDKKHEEQMLKYMEESDPGIYFKNHILPCLKPAIPDDYILWLKGFLGNGGKPTHYYDYNMTYDFYVATKDFQIPDKKYCGSRSFHVIVPIGISVLHMGFDHCSLFLMDGFKSDHWVPIFKNTLF